MLAHLFAIRRHRVLLVVALGAVLLPAACGSQTPASSPGEGAGAASTGATAGAGATTGAGANGTGVGASTGTGAGAGPMSQDGGMPPPGMMDDGGVVPDNTGLPMLPPLSHVGALVRGNSARVTFDPYPGAVDYRVYVLPDKSDILLANDGSLAGIKNETYRCAGYRAASQIYIDGNAGPDAIPDWVFTSTSVDNANVDGYTRSTASATLGYAFGDVGTGIVPVYAVGNPSGLADEYENGVREPETRGKLYVEDNSTYLAKGWRNDGIAFYAPASASSTACGADTPVQILTTDVANNGGSDHLYYPAGGAEANARGAGTPAFFACPKQGATTQPLMRVYYDELGVGHDELALGMERFGRARCQGSTFGACATAPQSLWEVHWSNITAPTTLVVEALDAGCPFQGLMGASSLGPVSEGDGFSEPLTTMDVVRPTATNGEIFLNGQFDKTTPHPIARSIVQVAPATRPAMDFASDFANHPETFAMAPGDCGVTAAFAKVGQTTDYTCQDDYHLQSETYDVLERGFYSLGIVEGELSDFNGSQFRMTPKNTTATVSANAYLHVAMEVSSFTTDRRYPQIIVSQQDMMTSQWLLIGSDDTNPAIQPVLIMQPFDQQRKVMEIQLCNQRRWDVNYQCPYFLLEKADSKTPGPPTMTDFTPHPELIDHLQPDDSARYDLYLSSSRAYVFFEGSPYGCANLSGHSPIDIDGATIAPPALSPSAQVTVSIGSVLYHPGAQGDITQLLSAFDTEHEYWSDFKHFDYFAFKSGEPAPAWDEGLFPCLKNMVQNAIPGEP